MFPPVSYLSFVPPSHTQLLVALKSFGPQRACALAHTNAPQRNPPWFPPSILRLVGDCFLQAVKDRVGQLCTDEGSADELKYSCHQALDLMRAELQKLSIAHPKVTGPHVLAFFWSFCSTACVSGG